jgi:hypothetical protein
MENIASLGSTGNGIISPSEGLLEVNWLCPKMGKFPTQMAILKGTLMINHDKP